MSAAQPDIPSHITDVLGKTLPVTRTWPDDSWECAALRGSRCGSPAPYPEC